jgi:hypothetical protein
VASTFLFQLVCCCLLQLVAISNWLVRPGVSSLVFTLSQQQQGRWMLRFKIRLLQRFLNFPYLSLKETSRQFPAMQSGPSDLLYASSSYTVFNEISPAKMPHWFQCMTWLLFGLVTGMLESNNSPLASATGGTNSRVFLLFWNGAPFFWEYSKAPIFLMDQINQGSRFSSTRTIYWYFR